MIKKIMSLFLVMFLLIAAAPVFAAAGPKEQLKTTVDKVLEVLKDKSLSPEQSREQVAALIKERFNFRAMSQGVLGINWRRADQQQRDRFIELFTEVLKNSYLGRIEAYSNEKVQYGDQRIEGNRAVVDTTIVTKQNKEIPVSYSMVHEDDQWLVYDVKIEGVSLVLNYRTSYAEIVQKSGVNGLLKQMTAKVKELNSGADKGGKGQ